MERFGKDIGAAVLAGLAVAAIWAVIGIASTHGSWSWPDFFGRGVAISVPVGMWKILGISGIILAIGLLVLFASIMLLIVPLAFM
jgi:hypothetical protein